METGSNFRSISIPYFWYTIFLFRLSEMFSDRRYSFSLSLTKWKKQISYFFYRSPRQDGSGFTCGEREKEKSVESSFPSWPSNPTFFSAYLDPCSSLSTIPDTSIKWLHFLLSATMTFCLHTQFSSIQVFKKVIHASICQHACQAVQNRPH